ncbi:hypothetical protein LEP1GSC161_1908 [Leptospira santarosai str. CBC1416]|uniref:Uncharacterized protein n=2 Tax=Leptospira santarosai TaxID=28183 RepID=M6ULI7_9LEPT|nr:hypothetical protein LEP1GSC068_2749 [Leptospira sp. Fiocruz LV3954]EKR91246.1 hypothetical protein LEP1GSC163_3528 [Leptospira santarosai str. CBC379]EMF91931.1 hypothetical protein LEP1GSC005_3691 [Leptospira santarosai str. ST188]EMI63021.1 hypothetical protein LEP1GSC076_1358 [Leptospira sp. Fiocruz LV4135]EMO16060.1 hypothetical protein LEP1GSC165_3001 [Leptospira santarosai str. CBC523]EMO22411.1 hypothetical protein LEP1GSC168_2491 [Leptospira santarosai str. HAI134]EMO43671.1 hypot
MKFRAHTFSTSVKLRKSLILLFLGKKPYLENHGHDSSLVGILR